MTDASFAAVPSRWDIAVFSLKAHLFRLRRSFREAAARPAIGPYAKSSKLAAARVVAEIVSPLWHRQGGTRERDLTLGKIENLRRAAKAIDGIEVPAGGVFSFWRQVGRPNRLRGFVQGRELREGCIIRTVGGGLCQISNGLYEAALAAGFSIVERHAHSRLVPGSRAALGRDATVFWNYVDLRFSSPSAFRVEAKLTAKDLVIRFRSERAGNATHAPDSAVKDAANDCTTCGRVTCHLNDQDQALKEAALPAAWLVDACWPEYVALMKAEASKQDTLFVPQRLKKSARYDWPSDVTCAEKHATIVALKRALALRRLPGQGRALQAELLRHERALAQAYARKLDYRQGRAVVSHNLLPHLWQLGALRGREFDVLMERLPMDVLQARLGEAKRHYPESPTLADFRAPEELVAAENEALDAARRLVTPHREVAALFGARAVTLDWVKPKVARIEPQGRTILFPASPLARKGLYALREAGKGLDIEIAVLGRAREGVCDPWPSLKVRKFQSWPEQLAGVVLPALVEHQPRALLQALAMGLPVIATPACGLPTLPGLTLVPEYNIDALRQALKALIPA